MTITIDILGSCVTRDAFAFIEHDFKLNSYYPRNSLISIYSPPLHINIDAIELKSEYQKRLVHRDVTKEFFNYIKNSTSDMLIIDLIDERLGTLKGNGTYLTNSYEFRQSNLSKLLKYEVLEFNQNYYELWELSALQFIHDINKRPFKKIVLHKSYYVDSYLTKEGSILEFKDERTVELINKNNKFLKRLYSFLERNIPNLEVIELSGYQADESHKWGLTPFHYELNYYNELMEKLKHLEL